MRFIFLVVLIFPTTSFAQRDTSSYKVIIGDSIYSTCWEKFGYYLDSDKVTLSTLKNSKRTYIQLKKIIRCDTLPISCPIDPTRTDSFIVSCQQSIGVLDTLEPKSINDFQGLVNNRIIILDDCNNIKLKKIKLLFFDEYYNWISFSNTDFNLKEIEKFFKNRNGNVYGQILWAEFVDKNNQLQTIDINISFGLKD